MEAGSHSDFAFSCNRRPQLNKVWTESRQRFGGRLGLQSLGISDERASALIKTPDATYVPPSAYDRTKRYGRLTPHKPAEAEQIDSRAIVKPEEPRIEHVLPDIYVTDPPYEAPEVEQKIIALYVYNKDKPTPYQIIEGRKVVKLPTRHCQFHSKLVHWPEGLPVDPPRSSRPIVTPRRISTALRRHETTLVGYPVPHFLHRLSAPAQFPSQVLPAPLPKPEVPYLRVPARKFTKRARVATPAEYDFELPPSKKLRREIDFNLPQPEEPTPEGAEPVTRPLFVNGQYINHVQKRGREDDEEEKKDKTKSHLMSAFYHAKTFYGHTTKSNQRPQQSGTRLC